MKTPQSQFRLQCPITGLFLLFSSWWTQNSDKISSNGLGQTQLCESILTKTKRDSVAWVLAFPAASSDDALLCCHASKATVCSFKDWDVIAFTFISGNWNGTQSITDNVSALIKSSVLKKLQQSQLYSWGWKKCCCDCPLRLLPHNFTKKLVVLAKSPKHGNFLWIEMSECDSVLSERAGFLPSARKGCFRDKKNLLRRKFPQQIYFQVFSCFFACLIQTW